MFGDLKRKLTKIGYVPRRKELVALNCALNRNNGAKVIILEGQPGTGKTFLAESFAKIIGAEYIYLLCHNWLSDEEMFIGLDVPRLVVGVSRPEEAYKPGVLKRAVDASNRGFAVVCIDELDKAPERMEALLLDFLQSGRVYGPQGEVWEGKLDKMFVFITTNNQRSLLEATLRRGFRVRTEYHTPQVESDILRKKTGAPVNIIRAVLRLAMIIRKNGASSPSLKEAENLIIDLKTARSAEDVRYLLEGWLIKEPEDINALLEQTKDPASIIWGEIRRAKWSDGN